MEPRHLGGGIFHCLMSLNYIFHSMLIKLHKPHMFLFYDQNDIGLNILIFFLEGLSFINWFKTFLICIIKL